MITLFITGTDTGVGKTYIGRILVKALNKSGHTCEPRKPIETGCILDNNKLIPDDASLYVQATHDKSSLDEVCPYRYEPPISPERAIRLTNTIVNVKDLAEVCKPIDKPEFLLVEGAGGFYSPLCSDGLNADLAQKLKANVLLIAKDRLGCINQTLLTIESIRNRNLNITAIVLNQTRKHDESAMDNLEDLRMRLDIPVIAVPNMINANQELLDEHYKAIEELLTIIKQ
ncbi:MAG: dethiobiotin synthase [Gammaproteobacteria bacterium]|nr:dethiobiotin synthase [Gammaproteobacteria bacterium]